MYTTMQNRLLIIILLNIVHATTNAQLPEVLPVPYKIVSDTGKFIIDKNTRLLSNTISRENSMIELLKTEFVDKYQLAVPVANPISINSISKYILIGTTDNPLIKELSKQQGFEQELKLMNKEGYILQVTHNKIVIAGNSVAGVLMGISTLRQLIKKKENIYVSNTLIKDFPRLPFRGIKLYLPGKKNIPYFKRFIKDFVVLYKYNTIILELNANMRLDKHPELNVGAVQLAQYLNNNRLDRPLGPHKEASNSSHQDNADGEILEKNEVADLVKYMRSFNIEIIPELPSLTHSYYLLAGHRDMAENKHYDFPDTYCPSDNNVYTLYFEVLDEYINIIKPAMVHVGHDEWRMETDVCERCKGKDYGLLYAQDLNKIHKYLSAKGIKTAIWGDHLLESVTGKGQQHRKSPAGYEYKIPGALTLEQVKQLIPKNILVFNWFWDDINNDRQLSTFNFKQVYGNLRADITDWNKRIATNGLLGGAPSSWAATTELNIGKDQMVDFLGVANLLWSHQVLSHDSIISITVSRVPSIFNDLSGKSLLPANPIEYQPVDISSLRDTSPVILNKDITEIIFFHACHEEARNDMSYRMIYNHLETAQLLGWYEIEYEDGWKENIPLRFGINILNQGSKYNKYQVGTNPGSQNKYAYQAKAIDTSINGKEVVFYEFAWKNKRPGKKIKQVSLKQAANNKNNPLTLLKMSIAENTRQREARVIERE